jgi:hypothetical protein
MRVWDWVMAEGSEVLFLVGLALLQLNEVRFSSGCPDSRFPPNSLNRFRIHGSHESVNTRCCRSEPLPSRGALRPWPFPRVTAPTSHELCSCA